MGLWMRRRRSRVGGCLGLLLLTAMSPVHAAEPAQVPSVLEAAVRRANVERKVVLVKFGASWCGWCRTLDQFLRAEPVQGVIALNYVVLNVVVQESDGRGTPGGEDALRALGGAEAGLPFYAFVDSSGRKVADSKAMPDGSNIGFPATAEEIEAFLRLIDRTAPRLDTAQRATIADQLRQSATK